MLDLPRGEQKDPSLRLVRGTISIARLQGHRHIILVGPVLALEDLGHGKKSPLFTNRTLLDERSCNFFLCPRHEAPVPNVAFRLGPLRQAGGGISIWMCTYRLLQKQAALLAAPSGEGSENCTPANFSWVH
jgi:hypothetical protein